MTTTQELSIMRTDLGKPIYDPENGELVFFSRETTTTVSKRTKTLAQLLVLRTQVEQQLATLDQTILEMEELADSEKIPIKLEKA